MSFKSQMRGHDWDADIRRRDRKIIERVLIIAAIISLALVIINNATI